AILDASLVRDLEPASCLAHARFIALVYWFALGSGCVSQTSQASPATAAPGSTNTAAAAPPGAAAESGDVASRVRLVARRRGHSGNRARSGQNGRRQQGRAGQASPAEVDR